MHDDVARTSMLLKFVRSREEEEKNPELIIKEESRQVYAL